MAKAFNAVRFRREYVRLLKSDHDGGLEAYEIDPLQAVWLRSSREVGMLPNTVANSALGYASIAALAGAYSVQAVLLDGNSNVHELPLAMPRPDRNPAHFLLEFTGRTLAFRDAVVDRFSYASDALLYNGIRILGQAAQLEQPVQMHFESVSAPAYARKLAPHLALASSWEIGIPGIETFAQMPPLEDV